MAAALLALRIAGLAVDDLALVALIAALAWLAVVLLDGWRAARAWRRHPLTLQRRLPAALALGVVREVTLTLSNPGPQAWRLRLHDHPDARLHHEGLPLAAQLPAASQLSLRYRLHPQQRGPMQFAPAELRLLSPWGLVELRRRVGQRQSLRVYPDFAQVSRYAWLAGDRRLVEMGIKSHAARGEGTDFKELAEYRAGDDIRHVDWKATLRFSRPIVRRYQDERDQSVIFLLDCGRRMRAAEDEGLGQGHFDHALNALMLLAYVALASGDAVGAMTYGAAVEGSGQAGHGSALDGSDGADIASADPVAGSPGRSTECHFAPRKGRATLHALMGALHELQPTTRHADLLVAAGELMRRHTRRSLVVVLTNLRGEDAPEVAPALKLLRSRHLVMLASLRESALRAAISQPLGDATAARRVAAGHLLEQARRDALRRLADRDGLVLDTEPAHLAAALVNRYHAVKRARLL